jgi:hypothetical protein
MTEDDVVSFAPLGLVLFFFLSTHGLRRGLHSFAPSELGCFTAGTLGALSHV